MFFSLYGFQNTAPSPLWVIGTGMYYLPQVYSCFLVREVGCTLINYAPGNYRCITNRPATSELTEQWAFMVLPGLKFGQSVWS